MLFDPKMLRFAAVMANALMVKIAMMVAGFFIGRWLDRLLGTTPWIMFLGILVGLGFGLWYVIRTSDRHKW